MLRENNLESYAIAIFAVAKDKPTKELYYQQVSSLDAFNNTNPDFFKILSARSIDASERKELAQTVLSGFGFEPKIIYWVWTMIDNNCYHRFHAIALICRGIHHNLFNVCQVKVTTANALTEAQMDKIKNFFESKLSTKIELAWHIKPDLIGGLRVQLNNKTYNNTFRMKLDSLKQQLLVKKG